MARVYCELPTGLNLGYPVEGADAFVLAHGINEDVPDDVWANYVHVHAGSQLVTERHVYLMEDAPVDEPEPEIAPEPVAEPEDKPEEDK